MSNEQNDFDVPAVLTSPPFPTMHLDSAAVLAGGRRRVHRRRVQALAFAVAALLIVAPGSWLVARSVNHATSVPASKLDGAPTTGIFARSVGNLGHGKVRIRPVLDAGDVNPDQPQASSTYQLRRSSAGLEIARVTSKLSVDLHRTGIGDGGLIQAVNGRHTVIAVDVPADTVEAIAIAHGEENPGHQAAVGSTLSGGDTVAVIETSRRLPHPVSAVIWRRANGVMGASTGEQPVTARAGTHKFYYFRSLGVLGFHAPRDSAYVRERSLGVGVRVDGTREDYAIAGLYPRGVAKVRLSPAMPGAAVRVQPLPGTRWDLVTVQYRADSNAALPKVLSNYGTWDPAGGGQPPAAAPRGQQAP